MPFNGPPALPLSGGTVTGSIVIANAADPTKYATEYVDSSGTLTLTNTAAAAMVTVTQSGLLTTAAAALIYGGANPVSISGAANGGNILLGINPGSTGPNVGAVLGNIIGTGALMAQVPTSTAVGGNARGANAVDWQTTRSGATMVANGGISTLSGGKNNTASGAQSVVAGGEANIASAPWSQITGGRDNNANGQESRAGGRGSAVHSIYGADVFASGSLATGGDAQSGTYILRGQSVAGAAVRLTADGAAAGAANVCNLPNNTSWMGYLSIIARDTTLGGANFASWRNAGFSLVRGANAASAAVPDGSSTFTSLTNVAVSGNLAISADTANGGLNITFTPPNTNTWDVVAVFRTSEVQ